MNCAPGCSSSGSDDDAASGATDADPAAIDDVELSSGSIDAAAPLVPVASDTDDEAATTVARLDDDDDELVDAPTPDDDDAPSETTDVGGLDPVFTCFAIFFYLSNSLIII